MQDNAEAFVYHTPRSQRLRVAAASFTGLVLVSILIGVIFGYSISFPACIAVAMVIYFSSGQTITLMADRLIQKIPLCRPRVFPFADGEFSLHDVRGLEAWLMYLKGRGAVLKYTPSMTGRIISLAPFLPEEDARQICQKIQEYLQKPSV